MSLFQLLTRRTVSAHAKPPVARRPVQLRPADLKAVSGGGPRGSWAEPTAATTDGPRGSW